MRTTTFKLATLADSVATYPDEICFAFNPNYLDIESGWSSATLTVVVSKLSGIESSLEQTIKVSLYKGKARVYLSRLFELLFENPRESRCVEASVQVKVGTLQQFSFTTLVIWGNLAVGERFGNLGSYPRDTGKKYFERNLVWFRKFPFTVSLFRYNHDVKFFGRSDDLPYAGEPIYQDTKVCFFEKIERLAPTLPTLESGTATLPFEVIYYAQQKRFVVKKDSKFYSKWVGDDNEYFGSPSDCCNSSNDNKPLANITYLLETDSGFARYRFLNDELVYCGMFTDLGFEDIPMSRIFPNATHTATIKYKISEEDIRRSVFDNSFDYTFFQNGENIALIRLTVCEDTAGHYLRWVDRHGNLQYYLFVKGEQSFKNKLSSDTVLEDAALSGMYFANHSRTRSIECGVTHKCCAVNLPKDIFEYVVTIVNSPIVDLYMGQDEMGEEIWLPVNIQSGTTSYDPCKQLNEVEISFALPDINAQSL